MAWITQCIRRFSSSRKKIMLMNSLSGKIEELNGDSLTWYSCGPTVYEEAHLGHARTYICQDILRRVLVDHFNRKVFFVLGITDIDDKIINSAKAEGATSLSDFQKFSRRKENSFHEDMSNLGIRAPTAITRVSEHIPEIISYIDKIIKNGFAYIAEDSSGVYFDIKAFGFKYGKLAPPISVDEIESNLDSIPFQRTHHKRNPQDFVLWKSTKEGEPYWDSPWGKGRPGWHIECSAMAAFHFGSALDIHSGGIDLCFPHHNNEIAQCEAHDLTSEWSKFFIHTGHLYIKGLKMSKSLKNFISIKDFFLKYTADNLRFFCLQHRYRSSLHYSDARMEEAMAIEKKIVNCLHQLRYSVRNSVLSKKWNSEAIKWRKRLDEYENGMTEALANDLDTSTGIQTLLEFISDINRSQADVSVLPHELLCSIGYCIVSHMQLFGIEGIVKEFSRDFEFSCSSSAISPLKSDVEKNEIIASFIHFRKDVRKYSLRNAKENQELLQLCDASRQVLESIGVSIQDRKD